MTAPNKAQSDKKKIVHQNERITNLKESLVYYKEITETVREPIVILNKSLCVVTANQAFYRKFKVLKKQTEGHLIYELGNNQWDIPDLRKLLEHILPKRRVLHDYEVTHNFPDLGIKTMLLNARQVDSKQLILLAMEDITQRKSLESDALEVNANLTRQRDQLQNLNDAKDEFISLASHQLRTPATVVQLYLGMLNNGYAGKLSGSQSGLLKVANESNQRQLEIIEDLLRVARVDAGKVFLEKTPCDITKLLESVIHEQLVLFKSHGQDVIFQKPASPVIASIDKKLMLMVLENLLDNARKYSEGNKHVSVEARQDAGYTVVSVQDSGVGIRKQDRHKLFKKFSRIENRLSASVRGTGLGLYWAKKVLDLHGGSIEVKSKLNQGSTFIVKIPFSTD